MASEENLQARVQQLEEEQKGLYDRIGRLEQRLESVKPLLRQAKSLTFWDFSVYEVQPDASWLAVDRIETTMLLAALAEIDHWEPWSTPIEPRPQL